MSKLTMDAWRLTALLSLLSFSVRNFPEAAAQIHVVLVAHLCVTVTPWTVARQAPLSMGILQAGTLEWVVMPSLRGFSQPRDRAQVSHMAGGFFNQGSPVRVFN